MKILILNWRDPKHPLAGGAEISLLKHAEAWIQNGAAVTWFSSSFDGAKKTERINNIEVIRSGSHYTVHFFALFFFKNRWNNFDVIVDCFHFIPFFTPLYIRKRKIIALIHEVAGKVWFNNAFFPLSLIGYILEPFFLRLYRGISFFTVSASTKEELIRFGIPERNIAVIYNGVSRYKLPQTKDNFPTILFLNRISYDKGIDDALSAFEIIKRDINNAKFWIVGREERKGIFDTTLEKFTDIKNDTTYFGFVSDKEKFRLLKKAWILIHPSQKEGWGLTVIEAASQETPTVGYNVEGLRDSVIQNKTGILVDRSPKALAKVCIELIQNREKYEAMQKEAYNWSKNFDWEKSGAESFKLIQQTLKGIQ